MKHSLDKIKLVTFNDVANRIYSEFSFVIKKKINHVQCIYYYKDGEADHITFRTMEHDLDIEYSVVENRIFKADATSFKQAMVLSYIYNIINYSETNIDALELHDPSSRVVFSPIKDNAKFIFYGSRDNNSKSAEFAPDYFKDFNTLWENRGNPIYLILHIQDYNAGNYYYRWNDKKKVTYKTIKEEYRDIFEYGDYLICFEDNFEEKQVIIFLKD